MHEPLKALVGGTAVDAGGAGVPPALSGEAVADGPQPLVVARERTTTSLKNEISFFIAKFLIRRANGMAQRRAGETRERAKLRKSRCIPSGGAGRPSAAADVSTLKGLRTTFGQQ
jgi:hypothetical protein